MSAKKRNRDPNMLRSIPPSGYPGPTPGGLISKRKPVKAPKTKLTGGPGQNPVLKPGKQYTTPLGSDPSRPRGRRRSLP